MNHKSWVATTGLCILMATSVAQAHLIPLCVEAYESGAEVSGALPYWSASADLIGNCVQRDLSLDPAQGRSPQIAGPVGRAAAVPLAPVATVLPAPAQQRQISEEVSPEAGVRLAPTPAMAMDGYASPPTDAVRLDTMSRAHSSWGGALGGAGYGWALAPASTSSQVLAQQSTTLIPAAAAISVLPVQTAGQAIDPLPGRPNAASGTHNASNTASNNATSANNNANISGIPGSKDVPPVVAGARGNVPVTDVPEPETMALLMVGLLGVALTRRRKPAV